MTIIRDSMINLIVITIGKVESSCCTLLQFGIDGAAIDEDRQLRSAVNEFFTGLGVEL